MLFRSAANLVGTTLETANVFDAARRKDDFIAMLGHELRNPLASILTAVELVSRHETGGREHEIIARHTRHLARLVDDLLDISRVTRGQIELRREHVALDVVLQRAADIAAPLVRRQNHALAIAGAADVTLHGDVVRLTQIFGNLLTNAAKFTAPGGTIDVTVARSLDRVRVSVTDDGRGIEREHLARIFEPFVQVDRDREVLSSGLGLGLAIVRMLVERHGGAIAADSAGRGRGATFTVELPVAVAPRELPTPPPSTTAARAHRHARVLIVDDNQDVADLLREALAIEGFETASANDARAALELWPSFLPHAAVLDVGLPDLDGYELAQTIRARHGRAATLIAATGYGQEADRVRALRAGFDVHLVKPVSTSALVRALESALRDEVAG